MPPIRVGKRSARAIPDSVNAAPILFVTTMYSSHQRRPVANMEDMPKPVMATKICNLNVQGDTSGCGETPVDIKTTVTFWPGLAGQAKTELLLLLTREILL